MNPRDPLRVLSIDGGGMRGIYSATYLAKLAKHYEKTREEGPLDIGKGFDLITATSTGAMVGCALAAGVSPSKVAGVYRDVGPKVFPAKLPTRIHLGCFPGLISLPFRARHLKAGTSALRKALNDLLGAATVSSIWKERGIAVAIPAVNMASHKAWVFKTPHLSNSRHRDDNYRLADVCLAATAAPIYRSMARLADPDSGDGHNVFIDGGLWANNPVLVGLIDALELTEPEDPIEIFCLGTCPRPSGEVVGDQGLDRGLYGWKFGGEAAAVSISAQEYAFDNMARMLARQVERDCKIVRFPHGRVAANLLKYLDLDDTSPAAMDALVSQADTDVSETLSRSGDPTDTDGQLIDRLFREIPILANPETRPRLTGLAASSVSGPNQRSTP